VQILNKKLEWNVKAKIGSLGKLENDKKYKGELNFFYSFYVTKKTKENAHHNPGGGNIEILNMPFDKTGIKPRIDS
jgi:hypothetical protein